METTLKQTKSKDLVHKLLVTLEEIYNGTQRHIPIRRVIACISCNGGGCSCCEWKKETEENLMLIVEVECGTENGDKIIFEGIGNQEAGKNIGDVVFVIEQQHHHRFERKGNDLWMTMRLGIREAICGFKRPINTLDKRQLVVKNEQKGKVIRPNDLKCIVGKGMPIFRDPQKMGNLIIRFEVDLPSTVDVENVPSIERYLPPRPRISVRRGVIECRLVDYIDHRDSYYNDANDQSHEQNGQHSRVNYEQYDRHDQQEDYNQYNGNANGHFEQHEGYANGTSCGDNYYDGQFDQHEDVEFMETQ